MIIMMGRFIGYFRKLIVRRGIAMVGIMGIEAILAGLRLFIAGLLVFSLLAGLAAYLNRSLSYNLGALPGFNSLPSFLFKFLLINNYFHNIYSIL